MKKLSQGTLKEIKLGELKEFIKKQKKKGVKNITDYLRGEIINVLESEGEFTKDDFENIKENVDNYLINEYVKEVKKYRNSFSVQMIEELIRLTNGDSKKFKKLLENENVKFVLKNSKTNKFQKVLGLCKTEEDFKKLCNNEDIRGILSLERYDTFIKVLKLYGIGTSKDLEKICSNSNVIDILYFVDANVLEKVVKLYNGEIKKLAKHKDVIDFIGGGGAKPSNLNMIWNFYNIQTSKDLEKISKNSSLEYVLHWIDSEIIKKLLGICKNTEGFEDLCNNGDVVIFIRDSQKDNLERIWKLYNIQTLEDLKKIFRNENIREVLEIVDGQILEKISTLFDANIQKQILEKVPYQEFHKIEDLDIEKVKNHPKGIEVGFFVESVKLGANFFDKGIFNINYDNFVSFLDKDDVLLKEEQDYYLTQQKGPKPGTRAWFEKNTRKKYIENIVKGMYDWYKPALYDYVIHNLEDEALFKRKIEEIKKSGKLEYSELILHFNIGDTYLKRRFVWYFLCYDNLENFVDFIKSLRFIERYNLGIDMNKLKSIKDYISNGKIKKDELLEDYEKISSILGITNNENDKSELLEAIQEEDYETIEKILMRIQYKYFKYLLEEERKFITD